jgi:regulator of sigma E protease
MSGIIAIGGFLLLLGILVIAHELGHFWAARFFRIKVEEFGIGFPPRAVTFAERDGVRYTLNWIPLGGFVRFASPEGDSAAHGIGNLRDAPIYQRIIVLVAGPLMNVVVAILLYTIIASSTGITVYQDGLRVNEVYPNTPAATAGLRTNDIVLSVGDSGIITPESDIGPVAQRFLGQSIDMKIIRDGQAQTLTIIPGPWSIDGKTSPAGFGFSYAQNATNEPASVLGAIQYGFETTARVASLMINGLVMWFGSLIGTAPAMDGAGVTGIVGMARGTGEIIETQGWLGYLNWMAIISLNLAIFNLLPIPALDGSHIMFALVEAIRRKRIPLEYESRVHFAGFALLMALMVVVTISDIQGWINGSSIFGS